MTRGRDCLIIPHFLIWSFGPKIGSVDGICHQTDSMNRFYLDVRDQNNSNSNMIIAMHVSLARFSTMEQTVVRPEPNAAGSTDTLDIPPTLAVEETGNSAA